jgi:hypothetical protein
LAVSGGAVALPVRGARAAGCAMSNRRNFLVPLFVASMGLIAFYNVASGPRFADIHAIDVVRLLAAGMCFGAAIAVLIGLLFFRDHRSN